jgi:tight adherence protein C
MVCMVGSWMMLSLLSKRNMSRAEERLERIGRPKSLADMELAQSRSQERFSGLKETMSSLGNVLEPHSDLEKSSLKIKLANAGFRSESASAVYQGLRVASLLAFLAPAVLIFGLKNGFTFKTGQYVLFFGGIGFYLPSMVLWYLRSKRQQEIFLTLPDALDLMVVCVDAGLGVDQALLRAGQELALSQPEISEEFTQINFEQRAGKQRIEAWQSMAERTEVDTVRSFVHMLAQTDRFGTPLVRALRVFADGVRQKRRQQAEEMAAKTTVKLIFPLVLFIFPSIFIVLLGPAIILISKNLEGIFK